MVSITADQIRALSKLIDKAQIEWFEIEQMEGMKIEVTCYRGDKAALVRMNEYGRPITNEANSSRG